MEHWVLCGSYSYTNIFVNSSFVSKSYLILNMSLIVGIIRQGGMTNITEDRWVQSNMIERLNTEYSISSPLKIELVLLSWKLKGISHRKVRSYLKWQLYYSILFESLNITNASFLFHFVLFLFKKLNNSSPWFTEGQMISINSNWMISLRPQNNS